MEAQERVGLSCLVGTAVENAAGIVVTHADIVAVLGRRNNLNLFVVGGAISAL